MKLLSFNNRHVVPTLYEFFLLNTKVDILKNVGNQTVASSRWLRNYVNKIDDDDARTFYTFKIG